MELIQIMTIFTRVRPRLVNAYPLQSAWDMPSSLYFSLSAKYHAIKTMPELTAGGRREADMATPTYMFDFYNVRDEY